MTSKERVGKAILFDGPDRIPVELPFPWGSDFLWLNADPDPLFKPKIFTETKWEDEWGCVWEKLSSDKTMGQVKFYPLSSYDNLKNYKFPDYKSPSRYISAKDAIAKNKPARQDLAGGDEKFVLAGIPLSFIHRLEYLRGHEAAWTDPFLYPKQFEIMMDKLTEVAMDAIDNFAQIGVDGIISADDWGFQDRLMVSPNAWHKFWKPRYKKVYHFAHEKGLLTFLHSCGYIIDIIGGLIEAGLNVIQMDQQENMAVEKLSELFGGKICFWCPVDIQNTMINGSVEDVKNYAKKLIDSFGKFNGGFMAKTYPSPEAINHSPEKTKAMAEVFVNYGGSFYNGTKRYGQVL
ncbi:MAG: uroporphyrinogen decarboxylase family protein [Candidatus Ratteibacteria bacterium]|nr:uroporphyrinogen decarboxylase family protein [Candidatus Ratteibacteria bacterium]